MVAEPPLPVEGQPIHNGGHDTRNCEKSDKSGNVNDDTRSGWTRETFGAIICQPRRMGTAATAAATSEHGDSAATHRREDKECNRWNATK